MSFNNSIAGGNGTLVRNQLQSQNFVTGVSGWQVTKLGNAEFNQGTFRGGISVGPSPGPQVVISSATDDLRIYNSAGDLIDQLGGSVGLRVFKPGGGSSGAADHIVVQNYAVGWVSQAFNYNQAPVVAATGNPPSIIMSSGATVGTQAAAQYIAQSANIGSETLQGSQRGILGAVVMNDSSNVPPLTPNLVRFQIISITTNAAGQFNQVHNCNFTPTMGIAQINNLGSTAFILFTGFNSTNMMGIMFNSGTGANIPNVTLSFVMVLAG